MFGDYGKWLWNPRTGVGVSRVATYEFFCGTLIVTVFTSV